MPNFDLYRAVIFTDRKRMPACVDALLGLTTSAVTFVPIANATVGEGGKVKALTNGSLLAGFKLHLKKEKASTVTAADARAFCVTAGRREASGYPLIAKAVEAGVLKKSKGTKGAKTAYDVNKGALQ